MKGGVKSNVSTISKHRFGFDWNSWLVYIGARRYRNRTRNIRSTSNHLGGRRRFRRFYNREKGHRRRSLVQSREIKDHRHRIRIDRDPDPQTKKTDVDPLRHPFYIFK